MITSRLSRLSAVNSNSWPGYYVACYGSELSGSFGFKAVLRFSPVGEIWGHDCAISAGDLGQGWIQAHSRALDIMILSEWFNTTSHWKMEFDLDLCTLDMYFMRFMLFWGGMGSVYNSCAIC